MNMEQPPVSIIMPCYNSADTLAAALDSLFALDYPEYEVVVVDDCSTDGSFEILQSFAAAHRALRAFRLERNSGVQAARDFGSRQARYDWIASTDSDAVAPRDWLTKASRHFADADMVGGMFRATPRSFIEHSLNVYYMKSRTDSITYSHRSTRFDPPAGGFNIFFKKMVFEAVGGYDQTVKAAEDILLVARGIEKGFTYLFDYDMYVFHPFNPRCSTLGEFFRRYWQLHKWRKIAGRKSRLVRNRNVFIVAGGTAVFAVLAVAVLLFGLVAGTAAYLCLLMVLTAVQATRIAVDTGQPLTLCISAAGLRFLRRVIGMLALVTPGKPSATGWSRRFQG